MVVYPVPGRLVRLPGDVRSFVPADGLTVSATELFWAKRLREGDVSLEPAAAAAAEQKPASSEPAPPAAGAPSAAEPTPAPAEAPASETEDHA